MGSWKLEFEHLPLEKEEPRELLYHYTTPEGLLGILESGSIGATHVRYLSDRTELKNALSPEFENLLLDGLFPNANEKLKEELRKFRMHDSKYEVYIASFTDDGSVHSGDGVRPGDRLSQWRAYSNSAGGFSLGFDSKLIMEGWKTTGLRGTIGSFLLRCRYSSDEKRNAAKRIGSWGFRALAYISESRLCHFRSEVGREPNQAEHYMIEFGSMCSALGVIDGQYFSREAARFKDEAFSEECEWRIVVNVERQKLLDAHCSDYSSPIIHFRHGKFGVTPYIDLPLQLTSSDSPLRRIVVGPSPYEEEAVEGVKLLLESKGIKMKTQTSNVGVEVVPSKIPYRNR
jgi:hypothetical protein